MRIAFLIFISGLCIPTFAQDYPELDDIKGVEIYLFEELCLNQNSILKLKPEAQKEYLSDYKSLLEIPNVSCPDYINSDLCKLKDSPLLSESDIESFNWNTKTLVLTKSGKTKLSQIKYKYFGEPFTMKVKGQSVLNAWFWSIGSSQICFRVFGKVLSESREINFQFNSWSCGANPFLDKEIINTLIKLQSQ